MSGYFSTGARSTIRINYNIFKNVIIPTTESRTTIIYIYNSINKRLPKYSLGTSFCEEEKGKKEMKKKNIFQIAMKEFV